MRRMLGGLASVLIAVSARGQGAPVVSPAANTSTWSMTTATGPDVLNFDQLAVQGMDLVAQAKAGSGSAGVTLAKYPGHYTMLTARSKSGGAEVHAEWADFLFVLDGAGVELTGGTVVLPKQQPGGETRGLRLDGATPHALKKGDVIHIPAGTPHQAIQGPGQTITIYVIKVAVPATGNKE